MIHLIVLIEDRDYIIKKELRKAAKKKSNIILIFQMGRSIDENHN